MRKVTEISAGRFTAKIHYHAEYREYRIRIYENGIAQPDGDAFETDEQAARDTAQFILNHLYADAQKSHDADDGDSIKRYRIVFFDIAGGIIGIYERNFPQDLRWQDCRDNLMIFAPADWYRIELERIPVDDSPPEIRRHFSYTPDGDII